MNSQEQAVKRIEQRTLKKPGWTWNIHEAEWSEPDHEADRRSVSRSQMQITSRMKHIRAKHESSAVRLTTCETKGQSRFSPQGRPAQKSVVCHFGQSGLNNVQPLHYCGKRFWLSWGRGISMLCSSDEIRHESATKSTHPSKNSTSHS